VIAAGRSEVFDTARSGRFTSPLRLVLATQSLHSLGMLALPAGTAGTVLGAVAILVGAAALFACAPIIQTRLAIATGPAATLAFALNGSMIFAGQGLGTALGRASTALWGVAAVGITGAVVAAVGVWLAAQDLAVEAEPG